jgi:hypothetical protein
MSDFPFLLEDGAPDTDGLEAVNTTRMKTLSSKVRDAMRLAEEIRQYEEVLGRLKEQHRSILVKDIPGIMQEMGIESVKVDGAKVSVEQVVNANISADRREAALAWLRENGHDDIIKSEVSLAFGKGEDDVARAFIQKVQSMGFRPEVKEGVHPSTLKAFVRQCLQTGTPIEMDLLGVYLTTMAKIERK